MAPARRLALPANGSALRSIRLTRWPARARVSACHRPRMPAPTTVIVCGFIPLSRATSLAKGHAVAPRVGTGLNHAAAADESMEARVHQVGRDVVAVALELQRAPDGAPSVFE